MYKNDAAQHAAFHTHLTPCKYNLDDLCLEGSNQGACPVASYPTKEILPSTDHSHGIETEGERREIRAGEVENEIEKIEKEEEKEEKKEKEEKEEKEEEEEKKEKEEKEEKEEKKEEEEKEEEKEKEEEEERKTSSNYHSELKDDLFSLTESITDYP
ncbi:predicted protein [Histoplasma capsulatum var. duboisii H88]|uniref:Predicted protein n=1 Tax=Ajellomyces capsulatus (strain H88) TaxID=544711 RepID=F0UD82_AJEC8|nr:predicted protein [Histoplasma capsulatum var. duboisii H88]